MSNVVHNSVPFNVLLVDPSVVGESHILVNSGFISLVSDFATSVTVLSEHSHSLALKTNLLQLPHFKKLKFESYDDKNKLRLAILAALSEKSYQIIIFLNLEYSLFVYYNLRVKRQHSDNTWWVLHSHLISFSDTSFSAKIKNICKSWLLTRFSRSKKFLVCGNAIVKNLEKISPLFGLQRQVASVFHPLGPVSTARQHLLSRQILQGEISLLYMHGWHSLTAEKMKMFKRIKVAIGGNAEFKLSEILNRFVEHENTKVFARSYAERLEIIETADFLLHLPVDSYSFQASGALMDTAITKTPVIGLISDFAIELTQIIGPFGYFFSSEEELISFLECADRSKLIRDIAIFKENLGLAGIKLRKHSMQEIRKALRLDR